MDTVTIAPVMANSMLGPSGLALTFSAQSILVPMSAVMAFGLVVLGVALCSRACGRLGKGTSIAGIAISAAVFFAGAIWTCSMSGFSYQLPDWAWSYGKTYAIEDGDAIFLIGVYLMSLASTSVIESVVAICFKKKWNRDSIDANFPIMGVVGLQFITNPVMIFIIVTICSAFGDKFIVFLLLAELIVVAVECIAYMMLFGLDRIRAFVFSFTANVASFLLPFVFFEIVWFITALLTW